ncbi:TIGR02231 domain-containing protein [Histoplasma ohiense]|nr:TIGR02231 domain-containing protein [Histoplasma ohiense (nom. inval.)]
MCNMATDTVHISEISLVDTPTKSVTLGPERATIVREILGVPIKPGPNEIVIYGVDPQVDPDSIRVSGHGPGTITDIQTTTVTQRTPFEELFPGCEVESGDDDIDEEDPDDNFGVDRSELSTAETELKALESDLAAREREQQTAKKSLEVLDDYGKTIKAGDVPVAKLEEYLRGYQTQISALGEVLYNCDNKVTEISEKKMRVCRKVNKLSVAFNRARDAAAKPERDNRKRKLHERNVVVAEKRRRRNEHYQFYPSEVGMVTLFLDGFPNLNPNASGQNHTTLAIDSLEKTGEINISLTYVTKKAAWVPAYELSLTTVTPAGKGVYLAEYHNSSSEVWHDAKLALSTSETSFGGLGEKLPLLKAWHVNLHKEKSEETSNADSWRSGLENPAEINSRMALDRIAFVKKNTNTLPTISPSLLMNKTANQTEFVAGQQHSLQQVLQRQQQLIHNHRMRQQQQQQQVQQVQLANIAQSQRMLPPPPSATAPVSPPLAPVPMISGNPLEDDDATIDGDSIEPESNALTFQESSRHDHGLTTSYDIPGRRTLRPSSLKRRHVIAELDFPKVEFSHVIIPKLRPAAFLRAKVLNTSSLTLLRGQVGVTLDGTFMGIAVLPGSRPNTTLSLSLGVDPGIQVSYAKPSMKRMSGGFFAGGLETAVFTRSCRITNTKSAAVSLVVLDQVPVSQNESLKVNILEPKGLDKEGDSATVLLDSSAFKAGWGSGRVTRLKGGEIMWQLEVEKGMEVKLTLVYEAKMPTGQQIVGIH